MKIPFLKRMIKRENLVWLFSLLPVVAGGLFSLLLLSEVYTVAIKKEISAYPFGIDNGCYESAASYWKCCLKEAVFILASSIFTLIFILKRNSRLTIIGILLIFISILFAMTIANTSD